MIAGPMIGSALANAGIPLVTVLLLGAGFRFISSIVIHLLDD